MKWILASAVYVSRNIRIFRFSQLYQTDDVNDKRDTDHPPSPAYMHTYIQRYSFLPYFIVPQLHIIIYLTLSSAHTYRHNLT